MNPKQSPKKPKFIHQAFAVKNGSGVDEQCQFHEDEEDEEDGEDEEDDQDDNDMDLIKMDWQESLLNNTSTAQNENSPGHPANRSSLSSQTPTETQRSFNTTSMTIENWNDRIFQELTDYPGAFQLNLAQNSSSDNSSYRSGPLSLNMGPIVMPASLHQYPYFEQSSVCRAPYPPTPPTDVPLDVPPCENSYATQNEPNAPIDVNQTSTRVSVLSPTYNQAAQQKQNLLQFQSLVDQETGPQGLPRVRSEVPEMASLHLISPAEPSSTDETFKRVSIDVLCTAEQISRIMGSILGCAKSVTVRVES